MKYKIPFFKVMFSSIQNAEFIPLVRASCCCFWIFFGFLRPKSKMENNHFFAKKFTWCLVSFCKIIDQNSNFFRKKELNTLYLISKSNISSVGPHFHKLDCARAHHIWPWARRLWPSPVSMTDTFALRLIFITFFFCHICTPGPAWHGYCRPLSVPLPVCGLLLCSVLYVAPCGMWCGRQLSPLFLELLDRWPPVVEGKLPICTTVLPKTLWVWCLMAVEYIGLVYFPKILQNMNSTTFVCIWQILSNHVLTRLKRFVSLISTKLCN